jgi:hypothetical protein
MRSLVIAAAFIVGVSAVIVARGGQSRPTDGEEDYRIFCNSCHGAEGKGDGTFAASLKRRPADLTRFAIKNDGTFPRDKVFESINGLTRASASVPTDMPAWHDVFAKSQGGASEAEVKARIDALVRYVERLQAAK